MPDGEKMAQLVTVILFPNVYKGQVKSGAPPKSAPMPNADAAALAGTRPPSTTLPAGTLLEAHEGPTQPATSISWCLTHRLPPVTEDATRWSRAPCAQLGKGRVLADQVPGPRLASLVSCEQSICISLRKQVHRTAAGQPRNHVNNNVLKGLNTRHKRFWMRRRAYYLKML